jgi:photosynthetic reaction center H subunit
MTNVHLVGGLDIAELTFFAFFLFFLGLVWYLRGEDRREGYPVEDDLTGAAHGGNDANRQRPRCAAGKCAAARLAW